MKKITYYGLYFKEVENLTELKKIPKISQEVSEELYDQIMGKARETPGPESTQWVYLLDCVSRGTITPSDAYDCLKIGYVPEYLTCRLSLYACR